MILMLNSLNKVTFLVGDAEVFSNITNVPAKKLFDGEMLAFLEKLSKLIMGDGRSKQYPDVVAFGFWIRKASLNSLKDKYQRKDGLIRLGKGVAFHIAPSNVPVNFAYSLVSGLLAGNANVVRVPSKEFAQVDIICDCIRQALKDCSAMAPYILLVRYGRDKDVNDTFSEAADTRIVWGGDNTISELRKSPLPPRSGEITFADRYSLAVIDSDSYLSIDDKPRVASDFYNDTYLSDQNACTSPRIVIWTGNQINAAKNVFWEEEYKIVKKKYTLQAVQAVNKLASTYLAGAKVSGTKLMEHEDNYLIRMQVEKITVDLMDYRENSGFFFEYDCDDIMDIKPLCDDKHCQTIGYIGDKAMFEPLLRCGIKGVDRIVPIGKTMDFDLIWDGYDLMGMMTRIVSVV